MGVRELPNGLYESVITLPITVWHIIEHQRQQFDTYHQGQVPIPENQLGTHAMGHEVAVVSGHHYTHVNGPDFPASYVAGSIHYRFPWEEGQIQDSCSLHWRYVKYQAPGRKMLSVSHSPFLYCQRCVDRQ